MLLQYLPKEKVAFENAEEAPTAEAAAVSFASLTGINVEAALKNCGNAAILTEALQEFYSTIDEKAALIAHYAERRDWHNYTILVHALKSSARLIGASALSDAARYLEECGNKEYEAELAAKTPALLADYRAYKKHLQPVCERAAKAETKPLISEKELQEAFAGLKECITAFDYDSADQIMKMLSADYRILEKEQQRFSQIKQQLAAVNRDALLQLL